MLNPFTNKNQSKKKKKKIQVKNVQNELMVEIYSKSLFRAIGKVIHVRIS